nr:metallopeptidase TldD-related protein [Candidatus Saccharicenans sp.]
QTVPVISEPMMTSWLLAFLFHCVSGQAVYQKATFLADRMGEKVGNERLRVIDDGLMPGKLGSRPFDAEGVPAQTTSVIEAGILKNFLCNTYAGRKLGLASTGNAEANGIGPNNFYIERGQTPPEEIISSTRKGLLLTRTIGHGLNPVTGDISRGAFGLWIEDGQLAFPVSEIAISGNLNEILNSVDIVGSDLDFYSQICGPTIKVAEMTVAGL